MAATAGQIEARTAGVPTSNAGTRPAGGVLFDWAAAGVCSFITGGIYLDAWAHNHGKVDNTFFTLWHAVLYSSLFLAILGVIAALVTYHNRGYAWQDALPRGYELSLVGVGLFAVGGVGDLLWHELFGIELRLDAAFSPTHLFLAVAMALVLSGPVRAAWLRTTTAGGWAAWLPLLLSLTYTLSVLTVVTQWMHPFVQVWAGKDAAGDSDVAHGLGAASVWVQTVLLMGCVLLAMRRWPLPFGALTLVFGLNALLLSFMHDQYRFIPVALAAGLIADLLLRQLKPGVERPATLRLFAFAVPVVLYALYFLTLIFTEGITWSVHMWVGTVFGAGVLGFLLSYLLVPPALPEADRAS